MTWTRLAQLKSAILDAPRHSRRMIGAGALLAIATATAVAFAPSEDKVTTRTIVETLNNPDLQTIALDESRFFHEAQIERGDTLNHLLARLNVRDESAANFLRHDPGAAPLRQEFIAGRSVSAQTDAGGRLITLLFPLANLTELLSVSQQDGEFQARILPARHETHVVTRSAQITHSLFAATEAANIPESIALQLAELFASEIDFHKDLRQGDRFTVSYEMRFFQGQPARSGKILAAEFINEGQRHQAVWFERSGKGEYLTPEGKPVRRAFLRSPLEFSRISSGFSMRFHPILNTWRAHNGVDYAAPTGTPVRATADGVVEFAGSQQGYGTTIILKHNGNYSTVYAHLSSIHPGVRKGKPVTQGQHIGKVGQTGWATGPHLHYEFRIGNRPVNPVSAKLPIASSPLTPGELAVYRNESKPLLELLQQAGNSQIAHLY